MEPNAADGERLAQLMRAGLLRAGHFAIDERTHSDLRLGDALSIADPRALDELGAELAARFRRKDVQLVASTSAYRDLLLSFIIARELGTPLLTVTDEEGWVRASGPLARGLRALAVSALFESETLPREIAALVESSGGETVGLATLLYLRPVAGQLRHEWLVSLDAHRWPAIDCPSCAQGVPLNRL